ncbi:MAG: amidohydrolase family protein [Rhizobiaceae bacterium]|nr:amidohydrolase family protein [Rhizobiaceae bacterium]
MPAIPANTRPLAGARPRLKTPPGAVDCHMHFYMPGFSAQPGGPPIAELAVPEDYAVMQRRLGLERVVITQANAYQFDNGSLLAALKQLGKDKARGMVTVSPDATLAELRAMTELGVCGARIMDLPGGATPIRNMKPVETKIRDLGWNMMVQFKGREVETLYPALDSIEANYVIDHIAKFIDPVPSDDPRADMLLRLIDKGNAWFKIAGVYETSVTGAPDFSDVAPLIKRVVAHAPERIVWGSNWPHVGVPRANYPDDALLLDNLLDWATPEQQQKILVDNPVEFFGF